MSPSARLKDGYDAAKANGTIGGSGILNKLSPLASTCVNGTSASQDAVAFALSTIFNLHAEDRYQRPVTGDDTYNMLAAGEEHLSNAVQFVENGGSSDLAVRIIAALARMTPD